MTLTRLKLALFLLFAVGLNGVVAPPASAIGIGLQPTTVEVSLQPGERQRQAVTIANVHQERIISLTIGLADWSLDDEGQIVLAAPGDLERSGADWARFSPGFVTLEPGQSEQIIVDMSLPARVDGPGDYRFALLASTILPEERNAGAGVWRRYQIASLFYVTTGDAESKPEIVTSGLNVDDGGKAVVGLRLENEGNAHARLNGAVEIHVGGDEPLGSYDIANIVVLDGGARNLQVPIDGDVPADAEIRIALENSFVPQNSSGSKSLDLHAVAWSPSDLEGLGVSAVSADEGDEAVAIPAALPEVSAAEEGLGIDGLDAAGQDTNGTTLE
ncbi:MAG: hypothetical protein AAGI03_00050 [Pseudomonadota bacterium]